jgi:hypothetical protein
MDPELREYLNKIDEHLLELKKAQGGSVWMAFFRGMFSALGYVAGLAIVVVFLGWILQKTGLLEPFKKQISDFQGIIQSAKDLTIGAKEQMDKVNKSGGQKLILPDGREVIVK